MILLQLKGLIHDTVKALTPPRCGRGYALDAKAGIGTAVHGEALVHGEMSRRIRACLGMRAPPYSRVPLRRGRSMIGTGRRRPSPARASHPVLPLVAHPYIFMVCSYESGYATSVPTGLVGEAFGMRNALKTIMFVSALSPSLISVALARLWDSGPTWDALWYALAGCAGIFLIRYIVDALRWNGRGLPDQPQEGRGE